tara:strand:- start:106542 stop:109712 length:3171 start_codon:yes stop_codon:yes gene_type:complete
LIEASWNIPTEIEKEAMRHFQPMIFADAVKLLKLSRTTISFSRGDTETYFIVSGIVRSDRTHESKAVYKKRLEGTEEGPLSTNCDCHLWTPENHCPHSGSLYVAYLMQLHFEGASDGRNLDSNPPIALHTTMAVAPMQYGTILAGAHQLQGAPPSATWSALQYLLHDKKIINFPLPQNFEGRLIIDYKSDELEGLSSIEYALEKPDGSVSREISLFEHIYLFDWRTGRAFHIPNDLRSLIQEIRRSGKHPSADNLLRMLSKYTDVASAVVHLDGKSIEDIPKEELFVRLSFHPGDKRNLIALELEFFNQEEIIAPAPEFMRVFTFGSGLLSSFRKKKDGYEFTKGVADYLADKDDNYKKALIGINTKDAIQAVIDRVGENEYTMHYDGTRKILQKFSNALLKDVFVTLTREFGEILYRFATYDVETKVVRYEIAASNLFQGLAAVQRKLTPFGVQLFYDREKVASWSSRVRFERRQAATKWFDLTLQVNQLDLDIIKHADLETGIALTKHGLVILSPEQKELMRFMKKYVRYEGQEQKKIPGEETPEGEEDMHSFLLPFNRARIFELFELKKLGVDGALTEEEEALCNRLASLEEMPKYDVPDNMQNILRPYQLTGYHWLRFLHENKLGACLADDMGLGKTLQAITFIQSIYDSVDKILIVCPVSILINWEKEFEKFSGIKVHIYHGGERNIPDDVKVVLTSYGVMKREVEETFSNINFDILVLDEVQHLKNMRSLGAFAARQIHAEFRICLTGTPVENDLAEFYNIIDLSIPGIWGDLQFIRTSSNKKSRLTARKTASPFILRRTKDQVLNDLPPKVENNVFLELEENEQSNYKLALETIKKKIVTAPSKQKYGEILRGLLQLRQLCLWQSPDKVKNMNGKHLLSTKIDFLLETLETIVEEGHQAIIFSQFTTYLDIIQKEIREKHWKCSRIDGSQAMKRRQKEVDAFQDGTNRIFLISLKAGGVGLNLTAASYVFVMDPWWNPAVEAQAIDRAHRIGQQNKLTVYRPIIKGSVEEKVLELQQMKRELFQDLLQDNDHELFSGKLTMKDFEHLFE